MSPDPLVWEPEDRCSFQELKGEFTLGLPTSSQLSLYKGGRLTSHLGDHLSNGLKYTSELEDTQGHDCSQNHCA